MLAICFNGVGMKKHSALIKKLKQTTLVTSMMFFTSMSYATDNQLTDEEKQGGWQLLFNGKDLSQWRNYKSDSTSPKWQIDQGALFLTGAGGGDIITKKQFKNYELKLDWKVSLAGNSGVFILADELESKIYFNAVEVQILDNERHSDNKIASHLSGSIYDLVASPKASHREAGHWNRLHIKLVNQQLTVWQNGVQTVDIEVNGQEWLSLLEQSKFKDWQGFGKAAIGHIGLQDHSDPVWFKNIKIKEL